MEIKRLLTNFSAQIMAQLVGVIAATIVLVALNFDLIYPFYFENQLTDVGITINAGILGLLILGLGSILFHLLRYRREEQSIARFVSNAEANNSDLMEGLPADSILVKRQAMMRAIQNASGEVNHSALAAMLNADESTRFGLIRFINSILILTGVFGTIVSLSIALLGTSDLLDSANASLGGMGLVIHGMSTALSTTISAIISYVVFGYFYIRLADVQTRFLSGVEHLTSIYLLPKYARSAEDIVNTMNRLIKSLIHASHNLKMTQEIFHDSAMTLEQTIAASQQEFDSFSDDMESMKRILREGFRLPANESSL